MCDDPARFTCLSIQVDFADHAGQWITLPDPLRPEVPEEATSQIDRRALTRLAAALRRCRYQWLSAMTFRRPGVSPARLAEASIDCVAVSLPDCFDPASIGDFLPRLAAPHLFVPGPRLLSALPATGSIWASSELPPEEIYARVDLGLTQQKNRVSLRAIPELDAIARFQADGAQACLLPAEGRVVLVTPADARALLSILHSLTSPAELPRSGPLRVPKVRLLSHTLRHPAGPIFEAAGPALADELSAGAGGQQHPLVQNPPGFVGALRPYQAQAVAWLHALEQMRAGGILADEMGLGKTIELLAYLALSRHLQPGQGPALLVVPTSSLAQWRREIARFVPDLRVVVHHGPGRHLDRTALPDIVLSSYMTVSNDLRVLRGLPFSMLCLDEGQTLKSPYATIRKAFTAFNLRTVVLSGTPVENSLSELWSLCQLAIPHLYGPLRGFESHVGRHPELIERAKPFILRRTKADVAAELPPKTVIRVPVELTPKQREAYDTIRRDGYRVVREAVEADGLGAASAVLFVSLLRLQQATLWPPLTDLDVAVDLHESAKFDYLDQLLEQLLPAGRRVLVFSHFTQVLETYGQRLARRGQDHLMLTGSMRHDARDKAVRAFQSDGPPVMLTALKVGSVSLNLTAADTVVLLSPWWNPAIESQAAARAHRIGQNRPVTIIKLYATDTVDEAIFAIQQHKQHLSELVAEEGTRKQPIFSLEQIDYLFGMSDA